MSNLINILMDDNKNPWNSVTHPVEYSIWEFFKSDKTQYNHAEFETRLDFAGVRQVKNFLVDLKQKGKLNHIINKK